MTRKHFWEEGVSLEQLNPKGQQSDTFKRLCLNMLFVYWPLFCSFFATGSISTAAEPQSTKEIPTYVNGWIEDTDIYISILKKRGELIAFGLFNSSDDKGFLALSLCMWTLYWHHSRTALYRCKILVGGGGRGTDITIYPCSPSLHPFTLSFFLICL